MNKYEEIDQRLDLDNYIRKIVDEYPENDDDFIFFIRGKNSTDEFFVSAKGDISYLGMYLYIMSVNDEHLKEQLMSAIEGVIEYEKKYK